MTNIERIEKKFWLDKRQYESILFEIKQHATSDEHGESSIFNIYYDTVDFKLILNSIDRPLFKEKLRIRSYGPIENDKEVFVEIKRKLNGVVYKRRVKLTYQNAKKLLTCLSNNRLSQIEKEIVEFVRRYDVRAQIVLAYYRTAYFLKEDIDIRITFDRDIKYKKYDGDEFENMKYLSNYEGKVLMEIKSYKGIPKWLLNKMNELKIYQAPFSKIGACYLENIKELEENIKC